MALIIRTPSVEELPGLSDLCFRSKAVWGYDEHFMNACRRELSFTAQDLELTHIGVAEQHGKILGVVQVKVSHDDADLLKLFVEPQLVRRGTGRALFGWAAEISGRMGARRMIIDADPNAAPFYREMGACDSGKAPSGSIPGRMLPRLTLDCRASRSCAP